jgi:hypothetical protein
MRRKQKRGVYSNKTIKVCPTCVVWCSVCKGICKVSHGFQLDHPSVASWHNGFDENRNLMRKEYKLHKLGFGSLEDGNRFLCYSQKSHKIKRKSGKDISKMDTLKKREMKEILTDDIRLSRIGIC